MEKKFEIIQIGVIKKDRQDVYVIIYDNYIEALIGLDEFSHILVFTWLHKSDKTEKRKILKVHPRGDMNNPLTGVFATRSPARPNPIGISLCELREIKGNLLKIDSIDVFDGSPIIDIKPCILNNDLVRKVRVPYWAST
jgi:tRNA-Thr(GGU) m(6)t(6)A37 methyltransferase TsaA